MSPQRIAGVSSWQQQPISPDQPVQNQAGGSHHLVRLDGPSYPSQLHRFEQGLDLRARHGSLAHAQSKVQLRLPARHGSMTPWQT